MAVQPTTPVSRRDSIPGILVGLPLMSSTTFAEIATGCLPRQGRRRTFAIPGMRGISLSCWPPAPVSGRVKAD